jgi:membrane protease YdiL (CAAX protease family)
MAPLLEEILFRGMILSTLKENMHPWIAIAISSVMFGVAHGTPIGIIYATALGLVMGWLAVRLGSIIPSLAFHIAYNATVSYSDGATYFVILASIPILIFEIIDINRFYRGKKQ